jgi:bifunctional non-homologous end joining protein LigD
LGEYVAFDLLELDGEDLRSIPYIERYGRLWSRLQGIVKIAPLYQGADAKFAMLLGEREANGEGVVFKRLDAPYMPGRKGTNVKIKFWESATVRVCDKKKQDGHASFAVEVLRNGKWYPVGSVTLTKTPDIPESGTYREVAYLYVGAGGRLYQPEDLGPRTDVDASDCTWAQLKQKQEVRRLAA